MSPTLACPLQTDGFIGTNGPGSATALPGRFLSRIQMTDDAADAAVSRRGSAHPLIITV
ncbi:MAG TPA: hypothetical protein VFR37_08920 [Longimicrobium sp.]|nr:hypothetical protein [Longimicrobium sp.]